MFVEIIFPIRSFRTFTYKVPQKLLSHISVGSSINTKINNRLASGYVTKLSDTCSYKGKIHNIDSVNESFSVSAELIRLITWASKYYLCPMGILYNSILPNKIISIDDKKVLHVKLINKEHVNSIIKNNKSRLTNKEQFLILLSNYNKYIPITFITNKINNAYSISKQLENEKLIQRKEISIESNNNSTSESPDLLLSKKQQIIYNNINSNFTKKFTPQIIHGIAGSGKTEIYIKLIQYIVSNEKTAIVLLPEILLTTHIAHRFEKYFNNRVAIWHSKMTRSQKRKILHGIINHNYDVVIGARSAVFVPIKNLGLIIVDEEQESSYKQNEKLPYYNARDVALMRAKLSNSNIVLGSATPSLETYYNNLLDKNQFHVLNEKYYKSKSNIVQLVDMKSELKDGNYIISENLNASINEALHNKKGVLLLHNRRGYSLICQCDACNFIHYCKQCSIPLSLHNASSSMQCHHCDVKYDILPHCKDCNSNQLSFKGFGIQRIEEYINKKYPSYSVQRIDSDTMTNRSTYIEYINQFNKGKIDIIIGTQMIAKGLDFDNIAVVGIINSSLGLSLPDFRSEERTFHLISQVIGRAGRRDLQGKAIIQSYDIANNTIQAAVSNNQKQFYNFLLSSRKDLNYPPISQLCRIIFSGNDLVKVQKISKLITDKLITVNKKEVKILGPVEASISKIKNRWRYSTLIFSNSKNKYLIQNMIIKYIGLDIIEKPLSSVRVYIDIDPISLL